MRQPCGHCGLCAYAEASSQHNRISAPTVCARMRLGNLLFAYVVLTVDVGASPISPLAADAVIAFGPGAAAVTSGSQSFRMMGIFDSPNRIRCTPATRPSYTN